MKFSKISKEDFEKLLQEGELQPGMEDGNSLQDVIPGISSEFEFFVNEGSNA